MSPATVLLIPVFGGVLYTVISAIAVAVFFRHRPRRKEVVEDFYPEVTILKPVHGLEKNMRENLRSACDQDYPGFQTVFSVQSLDDPALPLIRELEEEFGSNRVSVVAIESIPVVNGKVQNLINAMSVVKHDFIVISDSDVLLQRDYLKSIIAPLADPEIGYVCTLYRGTHADTWYERMEQLTYNVDFIPGVIFAFLARLSGFCLGASIALRRSTLESIGGFEDLADYLVEDYELGRRILSSGYKMALIPHQVDLVIDLDSPRSWWQHQLYWDQNTWAAQPGGFLSTVLTKGIPFSFLYACICLFSLPSIVLLALSLAARIISAASMLNRIQGRVNLITLALLPLRDTASLFTWCLAICKRKFVWRGYEFSLTRNGRIVPRVV